MCDESSTPLTYSDVGRYMRDCKYKELQTLYQTYKDMSGRIGYKEYNNLELTPIGIVGEGFINEQENWILDDCNFVTEKKELDVSKLTRQEKVIYCGYMRNQWGHFIVNTMSRMWFIYAHPEVEFDKLIFALPPNQNGGELRGNYKELFLTLGLLDKIEFIKGPVSFKSVIVPELSWSLQHYYSDEFNLVFDKLIEIVTNNASENNEIFPQKVFFTRSRLHTAVYSELGMEMLDDFFSRNGYEIIAPEELSLSQMIQYMQNAEIVASPQGSTAHNILFGKKNQKLIITERNVINNDFQPGINLVRDSKVVYIDSFLTINSVNIGLGPFFYYPTSYLLSFATDNGYELPNEKFAGEKYLKSKMRRYVKTWNKFYHRQWYFQKCYLEMINSFYEAYSDSLSVTGDYLRGVKPLFFSDSFKLDRLIKNLVKNNTILTFFRKIKRCFL